MNNEKLNNHRTGFVLNHNRSSYYFTVIVRMHDYSMAYDGGEGIGYGYGSAPGEGDGGGYYCRLESECPPFLLPLELKINKVHQ